MQFERGDEVVTVHKDWPGRVVYGYAEKFVEPRALFEKEMYLVRLSPQSIKWFDGEGLRAKLSADTINTILIDIHIRLDQWNVVRGLRKGRSV